MQNRRVTERAQQQTQAPNEYYAMPRRNAVVVCLCGILQIKHNMFVMSEFIRALSRE